MKTVSSFLFLLFMMYGAQAAIPPRLVHTLPADACMTMHVETTVNAAGVVETTVSGTVTDLYGNPCGTYTRSV